MRENHINSKEKIKIWFSRLWIIIYILTFVIYIVKPICFDVKIYLEAARRANNLREFPHNIFQAWEHKYILNRLLFYMIFKITSLVISPNNIMLFELTIKTIYGILAIVIIKCFSKSTKSFFEKYKIREPIVFGVLYISIIGSNIYFTMQTEMTAFLITLIAIIFILKDKLIYKLISAFIISTLFWFKGVTLLNAIIILIVMLIDKHPKKEIVFVICWSWIFLLSEILLVNYIEPNEIKNMYLSTQYLNNFNITKKIADYFTTLSSYSLLWIGLLVYIINFIYHIRTKNIKLLVLESLTWIILLLGVYIQKLNYFYQIGLVISGILFSIFIFLYYMNMHREYQKKWDVILFFIMIFIILIVLKKEKFTFFLF